jgi:hypothetical protein
MAAYYKVEVSLNTNAVEVGVPSPQTVNVVVPTIGPQGEKGDQGDVGNTGPANSLAIGTVSTGAAGSNASATITGAAPSQTLDLSIPRGDKGETGDTGASGPANSLAIGTVTTGAEGSSADATISGTAPSQTLSLVIPVGATGAVGATGPQGPAGTATTSASDLTSGTLADARLSANVALEDVANTFTQNQTLNGTNNTAPNQTAASGSSIMTRGLADARFSRWENSHEIANFTGATAGIVSGGSTTFGSGTTRLRGAASGAFRSISSDYRGQLTGDVSALDAGAWRQRVIVGLINDIRCLAGWYPVAGSLSAQWSGRGIGTTATGGVYPYFMYRDAAWRAMKSTQVRGSASVFPVRASNVVTIETNGAHGLVAGDFVHVAGVLPQTMQTYRAEVTGVPTSTSFTYANTGADETGTTILGDNMNLAKIEELGSVATTGSSNLFTGTRTWDLAISVDGSGGATFYANGATVATGSGFRVAATANVARAGFGLQSLAAATTISDLFIYKLEHTINP